MVAEELMRVLEAGRSIRPFLRDLVSEDEARDVDARPAAVLLAADAQNSGGAGVLDVLMAHPATATWTHEFIRTGAPPAESTRSDTALPGLGSVVAAPRFRCPRNDYVWRRRVARLPIPLCPTHHVRLIPDWISEP
jgi:hypothetical protein